MKLRTRLGLGAVAGVLLMGLLPSAATAAPTAPAEPRKPVEHYLYAVTFTAQVTYGLRQDYGAPNYEATKLSTTVTGTLPDVQVDSDSRFGLQPKGRARSAAVRTSSSAADTTTVTDDGLYVDRCIGNTARVSGRPVFGDFTRPILLFGALEFPTTCTDNQGHAPGTGTYFLPEVPTDTVNGGAGDVGDDTYTLKVFGDAAVPQATAPNVTLCPGYVAGRTLSCSYQVKGTLTLKLIKKLSSDTSTTGATVTPAKAKVKVICPARCTIQLNLTPLKGGPTIAVDRISPSPRKPTTVTVPIPAKKRGVVEKSGGVRIEITYHLAGGVKVSETRTALLGRTSERNHP